ncbi:MAG: DUF4258 domain-containing protein [Paraburkholderia sp.]|uniref:DUF4258 domain-containing protein n=1 Tax=Paraburkholderia sp. TaxID=1926495 RepID=UPI0011F9E4C5|nr:DUF4258 domain-containing protein [Paraburkholderia sp.]TAM06373.1 MAG: DUF4258 domain-containing protein [Paraburkholderia sp.]
MGMPPEPTPFRLNDQNLRRLISDTAKDSGRVFITPHAKKRMRERKITMPQVLDCLRNGLVSEPAHTNVHGHWQCTMTRRNAGDEVRVAAALERAEDGDWIAVITVF